MDDRALSEAEVTPLMPWHREPLQRLVGLAAQGKIPHAVLLSGARGTGKAASASWLTVQLLCTNNQEYACGRCDSCLLFQAGNHGDLRHLSPEEGKRAIGIDPVRDAIRFLQQTAGYGERKILVVSPAEAMTTGAANALLKTLEEPSGNAIILLVSERPGDLPATVRSRCQIFALPSPTQSESSLWIEQHSQFSAKDCARAIALAPERPMTALQLLEMNLLDEWETAAEICVSLIEGRITPNSAADQLTKWDPDVLLLLMNQVLESRVRESRPEHSRVAQRALRARDKVLGFLSAHRRGLNLSRDLMMRDCCQLLGSISL